MARRLCASGSRLVRGTVVECSLLVARRSPSRRRRRDELRAPLRTAVRSRRSPAPGSRPAGRDSRRPLSRSFVPAQRRAMQLLIARLTRPNSRRQLAKLPARAIDRHASRRTFHRSATSGADRWIRRNYKCVCSAGAGIFDAAFELGAKSAVLRRAHDVSAPGAANPTDDQTEGARCGV